MSDKPVPKTLAMGLTKTLADGRVISINHPNPHGVQRKKKEYRSLKRYNENLLPANYVARNSHPQNGTWQCPVKGCGNIYTRKATLLFHLKRPNGHKKDILHDTGDGMFKILHDMREGHVMGLNDDMGGRYQHPPPMQPNVNLGDDDETGKGQINHDGPPQANADADVVAGDAAEPNINLKRSLEMRRGSPRIDIFESLGLVEGFPTEHEFEGDMVDQYKAFRYVTCDDILNFKLPPTPWE